MVEPARYPWDDVLAWQAELCSFIHLRYLFIETKNSVTATGSRKQEKAKFSPWFDSCRAIEFLDISYTCQNVARVHSRWQKSWSDGRPWRRNDHGIDT